MAVTAQSDIGVWLCSEPGYPTDGESVRAPGVDLCAIDKRRFSELVPSDANDLFWTHLELLRKCKFVGEFKPLPTFEHNSHVSAFSHCFDQLASHSIESL